MRAVWVDAGNEPDYVKAAKHGITTFYFALFDVTQAQLKATYAKRLGVGVYMAWNWPQFLSASGVEIAEIVSARVDALKWGSSVSTPKVQFDIEAHDPDLIAECLERWRELQKTRDTSWTMESFQGGWMPPEFVKRVIAARVRVVPQFYIGNMESVAQDMALRDLTRHGFPESLVTGFYDAAALPAWWDGFAFTQGRLP